MKSELIQQFAMFFLVSLVECVSICMCAANQLHQDDLECLLHAFLTLVGYIQPFRMDSYTSSTVLQLNFDFGIPLTCVDKSVYLLPIDRVVIMTYLGIQNQNKIS